MTDARYGRSSDHALRNRKTPECVRPFYRSAVLVRSTKEHGRPHVAS